MPDHATPWVRLPRRARLVLVMGFALLTTSSEAQVLYGSITGTVRDPSDAAIPGAFNVTNTPKFGNPNGDVNSGNFMRILGLLNGYDQRQFRLGLRFSF